MHVTVHDVHDYKRRMHSGSGLLTAELDAAMQTLIGQAAHLDLGVLGQLVRARQACRARAGDDDIALRVLVQVLEVAAGHRAAHLQFQHRRRNKLTQENVHLVGPRMRCAQVQGP